VIGKVTKLNAYKNGSGFFIGIENQEKDFMFFGNPHIQIGKQVEYEVGKPTDKGQPTLKSIRPTAIEGFVDKAESAGVREIAHVNHGVEKGVSLRESPSATAPATKDEIITRLACLKAASEVYSGAQTPVETANMKYGLMDLAKRFEKYSKTGD
jgi:hypothetical protein